MPDKRPQIGPSLGIMVQIPFQPISVVRRPSLENSRMLFPIPGCILSPLCLNMYMMPAQLSAATTANGSGAGGIGRGLAIGEVSGGSG